MDTIWHNKLCGMNTVKICISICRIGEYDQGNHKVVAESSIIPIGKTHSYEDEYL